MTMRSNRQMDLPDMICFRVTRDCNARCRFCLAPPEGNQPSAATLLSRIDWLLARGVKTIHFCGGEPTVHQGIAELLTHVHSIGACSRLTTNGISLPANLAAVLRKTNTAVKVSLHGDKDHHNDIMGVKSFHHTTRNIKRLLAEGVDTSIQATVVAKQFWVIDWLAEFCLESGVRRLSLLPFIPRGDGMNCRDEFAMTTMERSTLRTLVKRKRHALNGRLDMRWLDFNTQPIHVVEADGRVVLEAATGTMDEVLYQIPAVDNSTHSIHFSHHRNDLRDAQAL
jgi:MoaA/NifB/PqqE/SkfB family radical SAM enzyme